MYHIIDIFQLLLSGGSIQVSGFRGLGFRVRGLGFRLVGVRLTASRGLGFREKETRISFHLQAGTIILKSTAYKSAH